MSHKQQIRESVRRAAAALGSGTRRSRSERIFARVGRLLSEAAGGTSAHSVTVALYCPLADEPDSSAFIERLAASPHVSVVLPRVKSREGLMDFYPYDPAAMRSGAFGIREPQGEHPVSAGDIDFIIVPGVAFTAAGARLGRGKGFYDRYMSRTGFRAVKIGVCFAEQLVDSLPAEPHDVAMDAVVFE